MGLTALSNGSMAKWQERPIYADDSQRIAQERNSYFVKRADALKKYNAPSANTGTNLEERRRLYNALRAKPSTGQQNSMAVSSSVQKMTPQAQANIQQVNIPNQGVRVNYQGSGVMGTSYSDKNGNWYTILDNGQFAPGNGFGMGARANPLGASPSMSGMYTGPRPSGIELTLADGTKRTFGA